MIGAIIGDVIGSAYEINPIKTKDFPLFPAVTGYTDDTVLTVAVADAILSKASYVDKFHEYYELYPEAGFGPGFREWAKQKCKTGYNSWANGAAMRVSPIGWAYESIQDVRREADASSSVTHDHPEGMEAARAVAIAVWGARKGMGKDGVRAIIERETTYDLHRTIDEIRASHVWTARASESVPAAIRAFIDSWDFIDAIRNAVSLGGDADTQACIAGAIAEAHYQEISGYLFDAAIAKLSPHLKQKTRAFVEQYVRPKF
jgi:ADP-ribosylglycohydrolase